MPSPRPDYTAPKTFPFISVLLSFSGLFIRPSAALEIRSSFYAQEKAFLRRSSAHHPFSVRSECEIITRNSVLIFFFFFVFFFLQIFRIERRGWSLSQENYEVCIDKALVQRFIAKFSVRWWKEN